MADALGRHPATIYRELKRNQHLDEHPLFRGYSPRPRRPWPTAVCRKRRSRPSPIALTAHPANARAIPLRPRFWESRSPFSMPDKFCRPRTKCYAAPRMSRFKSKSPSNISARSA
ncbi:hypothetical protein [Sphingobium yanoikuyae]|uniref:hypothetical protein n=1 Tax=Sphingobium yanoikuyae TaxID=13690 RepID=UPI00399BDA28